jgi:hypothetical protein
MKKLKKDFSHAREMTTKGECVVISKEVRDLFFSHVFYLPRPVLRRLS